MSVRHLAALLIVLASAAQADVKRIPAFPDELTGRWGVSAQACAANGADLLVLTAKSVGKCEIQSISVGPGPEGLTYSALLQCPVDASGPAVGKTLIVRPLSSNSLAAGPSFQQVSNYQRCPGN